MLFHSLGQRKKPVLRTLNNYGKALPINVSGFVEAYKKTTPKTIRLEESYRCFLPVKEPLNPVEIMDKDIHNLLTLGTIDTDKIATSIISPEKEYYINRTVVSDIINRIDNGTKRLLVHSDIANGKTMVLWGVALYLTRKNIMYISTKIIATMSTMRLKKYVKMPQQK